MNKREKEFNAGYYASYVLAKWWMVALLAAVLAVGYWLFDSFAENDADENYISTRDFVLIAVPGASVIPEGGYEFLYSEQRQVLDSLFDLIVKTPNFLGSGFETVSISAVNDAYRLTASAASAEDAALLADKGIAEIGSYVAGVVEHVDVELVVALAEDGLVADASVSVKYLLIVAACGIAVGLALLFCRFVRREDVNDGDDVEYYSGELYLGEVNFLKSAHNDIASIFMELGITDTDKDQSLLVVCEKPEPDFIESAKRAASAINSNHEVASFFSDDSMVMLMMEGASHEGMKKAEFYSGKEADVVRARLKQGNLILVASGADADSFWLSRYADRVVICVSARSDNGKWLASFSSRLNAIRKIDGVALLIAKEGY